MGYSDPDRGAAAARRRALSRHMSEQEQAADEQAKRERHLTMRALNHHANRSPGAVVEVGSSLMADLSDEPGHVQKVTVDGGTNIRHQPYKRVRVASIQYGVASDVSEQLGGVRIPAGDMAPEDAHPATFRTHAEFIALTDEDPRTPADLMTRVDEYVTARWDPNWKQRERVAGQMGDGEDADGPVVVGPGGGQR